jgi:hypothetical protein
VELRAATCASRLSMSVAKSVDEAVGERFVNVERWPGQQCFEQLPLVLVGLRS